MTLRDPRVTADIRPELVWEGVAMSSTSTYRSSKFSLAGMSVLGAHLEGASVSAWTSAFTFWVSNKPDPDPTADTDWVQLTANHNWSGLPGGDPSAAGSFKDAFSVGVVGWLWGRFKFVNSSGSATITAWINRNEG